MQNHSWKHYFLEFLVVFAGLSLAFAFDRAWDAYKDYKAEEYYLQGFYNDISDDKIGFDTSYVREKDNLERLKSYTANIETSGVPKDSVFNIIKMMNSQSVFAPRIGTYESIKASGGLEIISNLELREKIVDLYIKYEELKGIEEIQNKFIFEFVFPLTQNSFDFIKGEQISSSFHKDPVFKNTIVYYFSFLKGTVEQYESTISVANETLELLNRELDNY